MRLTPEIKAFLLEHADDDPEGLALQSKRYPDLPMAFIVQQVKARQRIRDKLPSWVANDAIVFPPTLSLEQCSSESAAAYKAGLLEGSTLADLTGGFGVDAFAFSERFQRVYHIERDETLSAIVAENARVMGREATLSLIHGDGREWLAQRREPLDVIYVDPVRRDSRRFKVSALEDCEPNLKELWEALLSKGRQVAVKLSPGLDIDALLNALPGIREIHIVSIGNECKETFCLAENGWREEPAIVCANEKTEGDWDRFEFTRQEEKSLEGVYAPCARYLYEPNASIMKSGGFKSLGKAYDLPLLHPRTRFYTSNRIATDFPGRVFEVLEMGELRAKAARRLFPEGKANTLARNAGLSSEALKHKLKLVDGGELFAIGTTDAGEKRRLLKCRRI